MNREQAKAEIKARYAEYLQPAKKKVKGKETYICPFCKHGKGGDGLQVVPAEKGGDGTQLHCFNCDFHGDIVDIYQQQNNCSTGEAFTALYDYFNITIDAEATRTPTEPRKVEQGINTTAAENPPETATERPDYAAYLNECYTHRNDPAAVKYLSFRGISQDTATAYKLGYDPRKGLLIIPASRHYYAARFIDPDAPRRYDNPSGAKIELFNAQAIYNKDGRPVFIVEGAFDALSIIEAGGLAVALNSTSNYKKLLEMVTEQTTKNALILCLDNDDAGAKATPELAKGLQELNISHITADIAAGYKDPNEALTANKTRFIAAVRAAESTARVQQPEQAITVAAASSYLSCGMFESDIEYFKQYKDRKTGFEDIDQYLTLYPGLAALGGASSLGKTTFAVNLIDRLLQRGETVLYFSLEQLPIEIITKSLARKLYEKDPFTKLTNIDIKNGATSPELEEIKREYAQHAANYQIISGSFRTTAADIVEYVENYRRENGGESCKPIVIIDYLQLIAAPAGFRGGIREYTDENIKALKDMQKRNGLFVLMISNFNRSSNYEPVSYESFKETSMIEYTCDYIWGLQLAILDAENDDFYTITGSKGGRSERPIDQKRKLVNEAQGETPKHVEFVSLKNRNGKQFFKAFFDYYPQYDYYKRAGDNSSFAPYYGKTPFDKPARKW